MAFWAIIWGFGAIILRVGVKITPISVQVHVLPQNLSENYYCPNAKYLLMGYLHSGNTPDSGFRAWGLRCLRGSGRLNIATLRDEDGYGAGFGGLPSRK